MSVLGRSCRGYNIGLGIGLCFKSLLSVSISVSIMRSRSRGYVVAERQCRRRRGERQFTARQLTHEAQRVAVERRRRTLTVVIHYCRLTNYKNLELYVS